MLETKCSLRWGTPVLEDLPSCVQDAPCWKVCHIMGLVLGAAVPLFMTFHAITSQEKYLLNDKLEIEWERRGFPSQMHGLYLQVCLLLEENFCISYGTVLETNHMTFQKGLHYAWCNCSKF